jgi:hypothetical protein
MRKLIILLILLPTIAFAQTARQERIKNRAKEVGEFQLGMRSTLSLFDNYAFPGLGYGGMFRIRPGKRINTEWYSDYIKTDIAGLGTRETVHIGWSVMIYPFKTETVKGKFTPYIIGGNCFDYAKISSNKHYLAGSNVIVTKSTQRYTTAVQAGLGVNYFLSNKFNLSLSAQYMDHIGKDLDAVIMDRQGNEVTSKSHYHDEGNYLQVNENNNGLVLAGHLLITLSLNLTLFDIAK